MTFKIVIAITDKIRSLTFTFMHLADVFIQSDFHCIQGTHFN